MRFWTISPGQEPLIFLIAHIIIPLSSTTVAIHSLQIPEPELPYRLAIVAV